MTDSFLAHFSSSGTYYDVLDIPPSATAAEVREAYLRAKSAYNKDSVALYSLIDTGERESILKRVEEAYEILSSDDKRRLYDAHHGILETSGALDSKVIPIDRETPFETIGRSEEEDALIAPATDFGEMDITPNPAPSSVEKGAVQQYFDQSIHKAPTMTLKLQQEILEETNWNGEFLKKVREAQNVSIEEIASVTKISKTYLLALENEDFKKLPALVFVRGFLTQVCRILKLPQEKVLDAYLARFKAAKDRLS